MYFKYCIWNEIHLPTLKEYFNYCIWNDIHLPTLEELFLGFLSVAVYLSAVRFFTNVWSTNNVRGFTCSLKFLVNPQLRLHEDKKLNPNPNPN